MPTCMSAVPRSTGAPCSAASSQGLLVGAHRLARAGPGRSGCRPGRSRSRGRRRGARPAAGSPVHSAYDRCAASRSPLAQEASPSSAGGRAAPDVVVLGDEVERPPGVGHRAATRRRSTSASPARWTAIAAGRRRNSRVVRRRPSRSTGVRSLGAPALVQPPLGVPQARLDALELAAGQQRPGIADAEHRPDRGSARRAAPRASRAAWPPAGPCACAGIASSTRSAARSKSPAGQRVADRLGRLAVLARTSRSPAGAAPATLGLLVEQARPQHVGEEVVVAVPPAAVVERDQEQVAPLQGLQHGLATVLAGDGVAQRAAQPVQDGGLQQEVAGRARAGAAAPPRPGSRRCSGRRRRSRR